MRRYRSAHAQKRSLNLSREYVDSTDDFHIIGSSRKLGDTGKGSSAFAWGVINACQIFCTVSDQRHCLFCKCCEYQFTCLSVRTFFMSRRIEHFRIEIVGMDMKSFFVNAVLGNAGSCHFTQSINIETVNVQNTLDLLAHLLSPGLCSVDSGLELQTVYHTCLCQRFCQVKSVGRRTRKCSRSQILHTHHLSFRISRGHRDCGRSQSLSSEIQPHTACEQSVSIAYMNNVLRSKTCHGKTSGHAFAPYINVFL